MNTELINECLAESQIKRIVFTGMHDSHLDSFSVHSEMFHSPRHIKLERVFKNLGVTDEKGITNLDRLDQMFYPFPVLPYYDKETRIHSVYVILDCKEAIFNASARCLYELRKVLGKNCGLQAGSKIRFSIWSSPKSALPDNEFVIDSANVSSMNYAMINTIRSNMPRYTDIWLDLTMKKYKEVDSILASEMDNMRLIMSFFSDEE